MLHYNRRHLGPHDSGRLSTRARAYFALGGIRAELWVNPFRISANSLLVAPCPSLTIAVERSAAVAKETLKDRVTQQGRPFGRTSVDYGRKAGESIEALKVDLPQPIA